MDQLNCHEWLLTNGLGSFACGTVCDAKTRTYHGWLISALDPPGDRRLLFSHLDATLTVGDQNFSLSTNFWGGGILDPLGYQLLESFTIDPVPTWVWSHNDWTLTRKLIMPYGINNGEINNRILIKYEYQGTKTAILRLRPLIGDRDFHHQQLAQSGLQFSQQIAPDHICLQAFNQDWRGTIWHLRWSSDIPSERLYYNPQGIWYFNYHYTEEKKRGLGDREDLYNPGFITVLLQPQESLVLEAKVGLPNPQQQPLKNSEFDLEIKDEEIRIKEIFADVFVGANGRSPLSEILGISSLDLFHNQYDTHNDMYQKLLKSSDQFISYKASIQGKTIIAGYPWFNDWGRDTLIALPGLTLTTKRYDLAKELLSTFAKYCKNGLIPNTFPQNGSQPIYNSIDASLWWIETLGLYVENTQDYDFLASQYATFRQIYKAFLAGTDYNIRVDARDGLLTWDSEGVAITWMDAVIDGQVITPRQGKNIEINALWYSALCWGEKWSQILIDKNLGDFDKLSKQQQRYQKEMQQVKTSLQKFWNPQLNYFYDYIKPDDSLNSQIRPNAVLALSLYHQGFEVNQAKSVLKIARDRLLTPYGLRSLDPRDPEYIGIYEGDRFHRDSAYHQGTVWSWLIGPFIRAWKYFLPGEELPFTYEQILTHFQQESCLGSISEIFDGDPPHHPQGAFAQAWSVAEIIREIQV